MPSSSATARPAQVRLSEGDRMTRAEIVAKYTARKQNTMPGTLVPAIEVYAEVAADLRTLERDNGVVLLSYNTTEAARACGVTAKTVTHWCEAGKRFPNAQKTSVGKGGRWIIPAGDIEAFLKRSIA